MFALTEIEIEGRFGWAKKLPTFKSSDSFLSKILNKPFTLYHFYIFTLVLAVMHSHFFEGTAWTLQKEYSTLSRWLIVIVIWDFLWFVFNPYYTWKGFNKDNLKWYTGGWFLNITFEYYFAILLSFLFSFLAGELKSGLIRFSFYIILIIFCIIISPLYHKLYLSIRKKH